jgi:hypothetical protein
MLLRGALFYLKLNINQIPEIVFQVELPRAGLNRHLSLFVTERNAYLNNIRLFHAPFDHIIAEVLIALIFFILTVVLNVVSPSSLTIPGNSVSYSYEN